MLNRADLQASTLIVYGRTVMGSKGVCISHLGTAPTVEVHPNFALRESFTSALYL
jgi:hypothetical protein